ncbi:MAG: hypothetical protein P8Y44_04550 [Acidobacteriota bacterium]
MKRNFVLILLAGAATGQLAVAQTIQTMGAEFQVNTLTTGAQQQPAIAANRSYGQFLVVWESASSAGTDSDSFSLQARRLTAAAGTIATEFQVNTYTTGAQRRPAATGAETGEFIVAWDSNGSPGSDGDGYSIQARRFNGVGAPIGDQFEINTFTSGNQLQADVAISDAGRFMIVWDSAGSPGPDSDARSVQARLYDPTGSPIGDQFQVNTYSTGDQKLAAVSSDPEGNFVVVWESFGSLGTDTSATSIQGQRFDADGVQIGDEFQINTVTAGSQYRPGVAADKQGKFMVVWGTGDVSGQVFDADGNPIGSEIQVNPLTSFIQESANVAVDDAGRFVVIWTSCGSFGSDLCFSGYSIQARHFAGDGTPVGNQFQVNTYTTNNQWEGAVAANPQGDFVIVWQSPGSFGSDSDSNSVDGQRVAFPILADGFNDGTTDAWDGVVPLNP